MSHLTDEQRGELRGEIERQLDRLRRSMELTDEAAGTVELDQQAVGRLSRMDSLLSQGMAKKLQERERIKLAALLRALERLDEGTYGLCSECGDAIAFGRLVVMPEADSCARCGSP